MDYRHVRPAQSRTGIHFPCRPDTCSGDNTGQRMAGTGHGTGRDIPFRRNYGRAKIRHMDLYGRNTCHSSQKRAVANDNARPEQLRDVAVPLFFACCFHVLLQKRPVVHKRRA